MEDSKNILDIPVTRVFQRNREEHERFLQSGQSPRFVLNEGGTGCFAPRQKIVAQRGMIAIEDLHKSEKVLTWNFISRQFEFRKILQVIPSVNSKPTMRVALKNGSIIEATEDHKFYFEGGWNSLKHIVSCWKERRVSNGNMETNSGIQSLRSIERGALAFAELQTNEQNSNTLPRVERRWVFKDDAFRRHGQIQKLDGSQICDARFRWFSSKWERDQPQRRSETEQQSRKSGIRDTFRKLFTFFSSWSAGSSSWFLERYGKANGKASKRYQRIQKNSRAILWPRTISKKIWNFNSPDQSNRNASSKYLAPCLNLDCIESANEISIPVVYDLMIEKNSNYFLDCGTPILVHNSSKSWSLAQLFFAIALENRHEQTVLSVVRKSLPSLRATAMKDFFDILKSHGLYDEKLHNMSERTYKIGRSMIEFFSVDDAQKMRSRKRDYLWINEANELSEEEFFQLNVRTSKQIFMDYNPSEIVHWIYSHPAISQNSAIINSTYKDNPFLSPQIVSELLSLKDTDEEYWNVYGLGLRARSKKIIYTNWDVCQRIPEGDVFYGLDFGHTAPTALLEVTRIDNELWERELVYEGMTNAELIVRLGELGVLLDAEIWADSEAPDRIAEIGNAGWRNVRPAEKGKGSVEYGIGVVKRHKVHVLESSVNLIKEKQAYKWKTDRAGEVIEGQPHKFLDHLMDAERYAVAGHCKVRESQGLEVLFEI